MQKHTGRPAKSPAEALARLARLVFVLGLALASLISCGKPPSSGVSDPKGPSAPTEKRTPAASTAPSTDPTQPYDVGIYGDLESLDPSNQVVTYWHQQAGAKEELLLRLIDEFNRSNEWNIVVFGESDRCCDDLHQRITTSISDPPVPSMASAYPHRAATYAAQGALVALDPYVESERWGYSKGERSSFFPIALAAGHLPQFDAQYGWPIDVSMEVMLYNEDWLAELGYGGPPESWDQFAEMSCAAAEQPFSGATGKDGSYGYVYSPDMSLFAQMILGHGGQIIDENGTSYIFNQSAGLEAVSFLKDLVDRGCAREQTERYGAQDDFGAGESLFMIGPAANLPQYTQAVNAGAGFDWNVHTPPHVTPQPALSIHADTQSIFVTTPEEQLAAWLFIKWMGEPEQQAQWAAGTACFPIHRDTTGLLDDYAAENPLYEKAFGFMAYGHSAEVPVAGHDACRPVIADMLRAVTAGEDPKPQLDAAAQQCNDGLNQVAPSSRTNSG